MTRLRKYAGVGILLATATLYGALALLRGHSAAAEAPADLSARDAALDVWRGLALLAGPGQPAVVLDLRPRERFDLYHLPGAESLPGASASAVAARARGGRAVLLISDKDADAATLVGETRRLAPGVKVHFVLDGARALYLALELPVPLFNDTPVPFGYAGSLRQVRAWLRQPAGADWTAVFDALGVISRAAYAPTALQSKKKPAAGGAKKKISGGCG